MPEQSTDGKSASARPASFFARVRALFRPPAMPGTAERRRASAMEHSEASASEQGKVSASEPGEASASEHGKNTSAPQADQLQRSALSRLSLAGRLLTGATIWLIVGLLASSFFLNQTFRNFALRSFDQELMRQMDALVASIELDSAGNIVTTSLLGDQRYHRPFNGAYWQAATDELGVQQRSRSLFDAPLDMDPALSTPEGRFFTMEGPLNQQLRVLQTYSDFPTGRLHILLAHDIGEVGVLTRDVRRFLAIGLPLLGLVMLIGILLQVRFGLRPLRSLIAALASMRAGREDRLDGAFSHDLRTLADEINSLQDRNDQIVDRARKNTGNLAHALKTPLAVLQNSASAARRTRDGTEVDLTPEELSAQVQDMRAVIDRYLTRSRKDAAAQSRSVRVRIAPPLTALALTMSRIFGGRAVTFTADLPDDLLFRGEESDLLELMGNLLENAGKWAAAEVHLSAQVDGEMIELAVEDDGPGIPAADRARALRRGQRLDEQTPGTGLGLSIVADLVEAYGGRVELGESSSGGLKVCVRLPGLKA